MILVLWRLKFATQVQSQISMGKTEIHMIILPHKIFILELKKNVWFNINLNGKFLINKLNN